MNNKYKLEKISQASLISFFPKRANGIEFFKNQNVSNWMDEFKGGAFIVMPLRQGEQIIRDINQKYNVKPVFSSHNQFRLFSYSIPLEGSKGAFLYGKTSLRPNVLSSYQTYIWMQLERHYFWSSPIHHMIDFFCYLKYYFKLNLGPDNKTSHFTQSSPILLLIKF
jgi:hypothetical protein